MNLGGSFINAERTSQSQPNQLLKNNDNDGGTKNYGGTKNELNEPNVGYRQITSNYGNVGAYGGGPLGAASSRSQSRSIIESLMGSFLGSSVDNNEYGANGMSLSNSGGTDIEAIVRTLTRNGAKKADISEQGVLELVYWRDPRKSGAMLAILFFVLYLFQKFTVLAIFVYSALGFLLATIGLRLYKLAETNFRKENDGGNPFQHFLDLELSVPVDKLHNYVDVVIEHAMSFFKKLRHIYLVENLLDSIKFGLLLYSLTYVAGWFSGVTLITLFIIAVFTVPKTYELYKEPIDNYIKLIWEQIEHYSNMVQEKLPFLKMALAPEKKEE